MLATAFTPALAIRSSVSLDRSEVGLLGRVRIVEMPCDISASRCLLKRIAFENETTFSRSRRKAKNPEAAASRRAHRLRPAADFELTSWPRRDWRPWPWVRRDLFAGRAPAAARLQACR